jgi:hypothetical protein
MPWMREKPNSRQAREVVELAGKIEWRSMAEANTPLPLTASRLPRVVVGRWRLSALEGGNSVGIDTELEQMAHMIQAEQLVEPQVVIPVPRQIAADRNSSPNTRQRVQGNFSALFA